MKRLLVSLGSVALLVVIAQASPNNGGSLLKGGSPTAGADPMFDFTFTSNDLSVSVTGSLSAIANGDGTFTATGGTLSVLQGGIVTSSVSGLLVQNPTPTGEVVSTDGLWLYDDQLLPGKNPLITNGGLLFSMGGSEEINIFSNGPSLSTPNGTYQIYESNGGSWGNNLYGNVTVAQTTPEPFTLALLAGGAALAIRRRVSKA